MVYCFAFGCNTNSNSSSGKSMFAFPPDTKQKKFLRKQWIAACNRKKEDIDRAKYPRLCEDHFSQDSFRKIPEVARQIGCRLDLKKDAVPDPRLFFKVAKDNKETDQGSPNVTRRSLAFQKRQNLDLLNDHMEPMEEEAPENDDICKDVSVQCSLKAITINKATLKRPQVNTKSTQVKKVEVKHVAIECKLIQPKEKLRCFKNYGEKSSEYESSSSEDDDDNDIDWTPLMQESESDDDETSLEHDPELIEVDDELRNDDPAHKERKFLVFESCLLSLLSVCMICSLRCKVILKYLKGSFIMVQQICQKGHTRTWSSQPMSGTMPQGNLQIACGILFSGSSPVKVINFMKHINILTISYRTFNMIQSHYLLPAVFNIWKREQQSIFNTIRRANTEVVVGGDGRCDSPGHSAKYGSYTMIDLENSKILDMQLIQSNEVTSSQAMELEGLIRCFHTLERNNITVSKLITDRHRSVQKYMRENKPMIEHYYDIWHMAKGIYKKLIALAKKAGYGIIKDWAKSISNHLYWCASSSNGDQNLVRQKWQSVGNHVANIHEGHGPQFPKCEHGPLEDRNWIVPGSRAHKGLQLLIHNKVFVKDIGKLSPSEQTSSVCFFAPKMLHYFYPAMKARLILGCLHYNENAERAQARDENGQLLWSVSYPKYKEGGTVKEVKASGTFVYVQKLNMEVQSLRNSYPSYKKVKELIALYNDIIPPPLSSRAVKQPKEELVRNYTTRFPNKSKQ